MKRIYFATDCGQLFYEMNDRSFGLGKPEKVFLRRNEIDMNGFLENVLEYFHAYTIEDITHLPDAAIA